MKRVHMICNAHIDPIWQWDWQEGASAALSTFRSAVKLAEKYDYVFCHNEVTVYKYAQEYDPELFEEIRRLIKAGKWRVMGGWFLQPDCNLPAGESLVRQVLRGKKYFTEQFGEWSTTAFNVDPFGHSRGLVQILTKCGQDSYMFCRPYPPELSLESDQFIWEGFDGSRVKAFRSSAGYNSPLGDSARAIRERAENQKEDTICVLWGVGNHGGGPSAKDLADIEVLQEEGENEYIHSTPEAFFAEIQPTSVFKKSLHISMPGCYTSMNKVKQRHIRLENELYYAEIMAALAEQKGLMDYPAERLALAEEDLLTGEFHDVLPGSCIRAGEENGEMIFLHGLNETDKVKSAALFALCREQEAAGEGEYPIVVFNPHPYALTANVACEFMLADQNWSEEVTSRIRMTDEAGKPVFFQVVKEESNIHLDWRKKVVFEAELKPLSLNRFRVFVDMVKAEPAKKSEDLVFDNGRKRVEIDGKTGLLKSFRVNGKDYLQDACRLNLFEDNPDPWGMGAEQRTRLGTDPKPFELMKEPDGVFAGMKPVQVIEDGPIYLGVEAFFRRDNTRARVEYRIWKNNDEVDVLVDLFPGDVNKIVKLELPVCGAGRVFGQAVFGIDELFTDGRENVSQRFVAVESGKDLLGVWNDCIYGSHFENGSLFLSLMRGTTYCAHPILDRNILPEGRFTKKMDQSERNYRFRIGPAREQELERKALEFVRTPFAVSVFPGGKAGSAKPFEVGISDPNVTLQALKKADDGRGLIVRLFNNTSGEAKAEFRMGESRIALTFGKFEVKTLRFDGKLTELPGMEI